MGQGQMEGKQVDWSMVITKVMSKQLSPFLERFNNCSVNLPECL